MYGDIGSQGFKKPHVDTFSLVYIDNVELKNNKVFQGPSLSRGLFAFG